MGTPNKLILIFIAESNVQPQRIFNSYTIDASGRVDLGPKILLEHGQRINLGWPHREHSKRAAFLNLPDEDCLGIYFSISCSLIGQGDQLAYTLLGPWDHALVKVVFDHVDSRHFV